MPARTWEVHAVGIGPTERFSWRRQVAAAAGKKEYDLSVLVHGSFGLEVEEELFTMATQTWVEGVWIGKWYTKQQEAWLNQIREVQMWRQMRGPAGAVMCETGGLGIQWPQWHTLTFEGEASIDMRYVGPEDVKRTLVQQARSAYWKKLAAKHIWLEPDLALLRKKTKGQWTEKTSKCCEEIISGRRLGAEETLRHWLVG